VDHVSDADLYLRGAETLVASWQEYARGASGAAIRRLPGVVAAIFPEAPERLVYNNALVERDLTAAERSNALDAMEAAYAAAGVTRFAAWLHGSDYGMRDADTAGKYTANWKLTFHTLTGKATGAHIHKGSAGKAGPVIVPLCAPCKSGQAGTAKVSKAAVTAIEKGGAYVNVHTARNAAGEIRSQIPKKK
jgi:hypothetical protein